MNARTLIVASFAALIGSTAFAQTAVAQPAQKTRAEVIAELQAARANGEVSFGDHYGYEIARKPFVSTKTRAEVRQETIEAMKAGNLSQGSESRG